MLVFDKSVTLFDKLKEYDKESLKLYGSDLGLTKLSKFRKDELVQKVVDKLLDLDVMFYRGAILSDKQIAVLERGFNGPTSYSEDESDDIGTLNEMDFIIVNRDEYVVPCDVVKAEEDKGRAVPGLSEACFLGLEMPVLDRRDVCVHAYGYYAAGSKYQERHAV